MRQQISGRETIQEVTLVEGRGGHKGQKSWILKLSEVDTVEQVINCNYKCVLFYVLYKLFLLYGYIVLPYQYAI